MSSTPHRTSLSRWAISAQLLLRYLVVTTLLGLSACTTPEVSNPETAEKPAKSSEVAQMYATVLDNIHKMYLDELSVAKLALTGLAGLSKLEPGAAVFR